MKRHIYDWMRAYPRYKDIFDWVRAYPKEKWKKKNIQNIKMLIIQL